MIEAQQNVFEAFSNAAPSGWTEGEIYYCRVGKTSEFTLKAQLPDGSTVQPEVRGLQLGKAIRELRAQMARPELGAWFSAVIKLWSSGRISVTADYDNEPAWRSPVVPATYAEEQDLFPRSAANQPEWFKQRLREARRDS